MKGPGLMSVSVAAVVLVLVGWTTAVPATTSTLGEQAAGQQAGASHSNRDPRWFWDSIRNAFPTRGSISNTVSDTFSRTSLNEAVSVILPTGDQTPMVCATSDDDTFSEGVCLRVADCLFYRGTNYGSCAGGIGTCCVFERSCDEISNYYVTQFTNPRYPSASAGTSECKLTVNPMNTNICQYRLDFDDFNIAGPDASSDCVTDFLGITGGTTVPKMCGDLTGQHVYININPAAGPIELSMDTAKTLTFSRTWNIKITQIPCDSPQRVPFGCTQFFNETSGTVKSLNYRNLLPEPGSTQQLIDHSYGVCIDSKVGYCELTWTAADDTEVDGLSFAVSGDATGEPKSAFGPEGCTKDYVYILGGHYMDEAGNVHQAERYCGTKFPRVKTTAKPYRLFVNSDRDEEGDNQNTGFALNFRHSLC